MPENNGKEAGETLDLLKYNYDNLHKAVWDAHKISWTMTGIYVPIISTAIGYLVKMFNAMDVAMVVITAAMIGAVVWFWYGMIHVLSKYNFDRFKRLEEIEDIFTHKYCQSAVSEVKCSFKQYGLHKKRFLSFRKLTLLFTFFLTAILIAAVVIKVSEGPVQ